jgi:hypothetical protein
MWAGGQNLCLLWGEDTFKVVEQIPVSDGGGGVCSKELCMGGGLE